MTGSDSQTTLNSKPPFSCHRKLYSAIARDPKLYRQRFWSRSRPLERLFVSRRDPSRSIFVPRHCAVGRRHAARNSCSYLQIKTHRLLYADQIATAFIAGYQIRLTSRLYPFVSLHLKSLDEETPGWKGSSLAGQRSECELFHGGTVLDYPFQNVQRQMTVLYCR